MVLKDLLDYNLKLVICGSAAGHRSARLEQYYAGRGNKFWPTLSTVGLTPRELMPSEYELLLTFGIGLTDLVKDQLGADHAIAFGSASAKEFRDKIFRYKPRFLAFNGKRSATEVFGTNYFEYGLQSERISTTQIFVAPSTSGAANKSWDLSIWRRLAELVEAR